MITQKNVEQTNERNVFSDIKETVAASAAQSKKRKTSNEEGAASSTRQLELPPFGRVELGELDFSSKSLNLPELIQSYLAENQMPNSGTTEHDVQEWFNGLIRVASSTSSNEQAIELSNQDNKDL
ncbi:33866_t:CDS:2, partial [Racocetra persica]